MSENERAKDDGYYVAEGDMCDRCGSKGPMVGVSIDSVNTMCDIDMNGCWDFCPACYAQFKGQFLAWATPGGSA